MNLLVTNIGRRKYFADFLIDLKKNKKNLKIYFADNDLDAAALNTDGSYSIKIPLVSQGKVKYLESLKAIVKKYKIKTLIPCTNYDLDILSLERNSFKKLGCSVLVSKNYLIKILLDKKKAFNFCKFNKINTPKIYNNMNELKSSKRKYFVKKKRIGHSSQDFKIIKKPVKEDFGKNHIIQDHIKGEEFHFDILNDFKGNYVASCIKKKISMRNGETEKAITVYKKELINLSKNLSMIFRHIGNMDCDAIMDQKGKIYFIDFNPRFGGGYPFTHLAGFNFLKTIIHKFNKKKFKIPNKPKIIKCSKGISLHLVKN